MTFSSYKLIYLKPSGASNLPDLATSSSSSGAAAASSSSAAASVPPSPGPSSTDKIPLLQQQQAQTILDHVWIETKNKKAALKLEKLDTDLKNYKSNSIKVSFSVKSVY